MALRYAFNFVLLQAVKLNARHFFGAVSRFELFLNGIFSFISLLNNAVIRRAYPMLISVSSSLSHLFFFPFINASFHFCFFHLIIEINSY